MKNRFTFFFAVFMVMSTANAQYGNISGKVIDSSTNTPLLDVTVVLQLNGISKLYDFTDDSGTFNIRHIVPADYKLILFLSGYAKLEMTNLHVVKDSSVNLTIKLTKLRSETREVVVIASAYNGLHQNRLGYKRTGADLQNSVSVKNGSTPSFLGSRSNQTGYFINGTKIIGQDPNSGKIRQSKLNTGSDSSGSEEYNTLVENPFIPSHKNLLSTFSIDVDRACYSNMRRYLAAGQLPPKYAVRTEEVLNYFNYNYPQPEDDKPFSITTEIGDCPWNHEHKLMLIGLQGKNIPLQNIPPMNLVFLVDVSGSMYAPNKLPLVKESLKLLVAQLRREDKITIVTYAGADAVALPPTSGADKNKIMEALNNLTAGGSTAGARGINRAYDEAVKNYNKDGNNRVILCTDGDFNVGVSSDAELQKLIEEKRKPGIFLSVLGFGMGNLKDNHMETLADKGNGNYAYIDKPEEAKKVMVHEIGGTLYTIAKDVKIQMEFNPIYVKEYRLIGYENRKLNNEDFENDAIDAGDLGSGHTVTALYEIVPNLDKTEQGVLEYDKSDITPSKLEGDEWLYVKLRYKLPQEDKSKLIMKKVSKDQLGKVTDNFYFASGTAEFVMMLHQSKYLGNADYASVKELISKHSDNDTFGYKKEFLDLIVKAEKLSSQSQANK